MPFRLQKLAGAYRVVGVQLLSVVVLLLVLNLAASVALGILEGRDEPGALSYGMEKLLPVYPGWSEEELRRLLTETWTRKYVYRPFIQHKEGPMEGRYVNVHPAGFRAVAGQGPWPPREDATVFVFGGSTTFGYGLADGETIPSHIQQLLTARCQRPIHVYNFGGGNFYSVQERVFFEQLISQGFVPEVAVFIDGINEWHAEPKFTRRLEYLMAEGGGGLAYRALRELPLARLLRRYLGRHKEPDAAAGGGDPSTAARRLLERWLRNRRLLEATAGEFGIRLLSVWQPTPGYGYDLAHHPFIDAGGPQQGSSRVAEIGYGLLDRQRRDPASRLAGPGFLWLGDLQEGRHEPLYVDKIHYTAAFSEEIARRIVERMLADGGCPWESGPTAPGGSR